MQAAMNTIELICQALRNAIMEQAIGTGTKLPEDAIGERFGVSRTIVRQALERLASEGLVDLKRNKGAFVATPSWQDARDIFDLRIGAEKIVVSRLAGKLSETEIIALEDHIDEQEKVHVTGKRLGIRLLTEFHILLADMTKSPVLIKSVREACYRSNLILSVYARPHSTECGIAEHRAIVKGLAAGDAATVVSLMEKHLDALAERALIESDEKRDIKEILAPYAVELVDQKARAVRST